MYGLDSWSLFFVFLSLFVGVCGQQAFKTEPRNVTVRAGATALLKCEVLRASEAVQWVKDGLLLGPQRSLPGYPRYSMTGDQQKGQYHLQILNVSLEDDGPYECQVGRSVSSRAIMSRTAWLNVQIPPSQPYIQLESDEPWVEGDEYTVTCIAPDAKPPAEITMFRDGEELTETDSFTMSGSQDELLNTPAEVCVARGSDSARQLTCRAKNPGAHQALETSKTMRVYFPPQAPVIMGLKNEEVKAGSFLRLVCMSYRGNPLATLHWTKDVVSRRSSSVLKLKVKPEDNHAVLRCESINQVSRSPMSLTRTLTVLFEPDEVKLLGTFEAIEGEEINLCCYTSSSNPPVHICWWLGFKKMFSYEIFVLQGENSGMMTRSNLAHKVSREDNGLFLICEAFNKGTCFSRVRAEELTIYYLPQKVWLDAPPPNFFLHSGTTFLWAISPVVGIPQNNKVMQTALKQVFSQRGVSRELLLILQPTDNLATYRFVLVIVSQSVPAVSVEIMAKQQELSNHTANISWSLGLVIKLSLTLESHHWKKRMTCQAFSNVLSEGVNNFYTLNFSDEQPDQVQVIEDEITCEWIFQGEKLVKEEDPRYHFNDWTLEIINVSRRDEGDSIIECSNAEGKNRTMLKLDVQYAPTVRMKSDPVYVNLGDTAYLLCVSLMPTPSPTGEGEVDDLGEQSEDEGTGLLTIYIYIYIYIFIYIYRFQINAVFAPELQKGPQWRKVARQGDGGNDANVVCQAQGVPRVHFTCAKKRFPLDLNLLSLSVSLCVSDHPDHSDLKLLCVDHNSVTLEWMPGFDGGLTHNFRLRYQWAGSASFMYVDVFSQTATVYTVTSLNPSTTYNFSVNAINTMGESSYADNKKILTVTTADVEETDDGVSPADQDSAPAGRGLPVYLVVTLAVGGRSCFLLAKWKRDSSEPDSSVYESCGRVLSLDTHRSAVPLFFFFLHREAGKDGRHGTNPLAHDYEEVRGWGTYEDLRGYSLLPPAAQFHPLAPVSTYHEGRAYSKADVDVTAGVYDSMVYRRRRDTDLPFELRGELVS
uniref:NPHS1 adhesion molecule, nephrin n=1 Tax=Cyprinus carpio TaxID=7962 RepID=A0A8C1GL12_CYPCA